MEKLIQRSSVAEQVMDHILDLIDKGVWKPGDRLPGEREFAEGLGISRVPLREAISALSAAGILEKRQGDGTYVSAGTPEALGRLLRTFTRLDRTMAADLFEARALVEQDAARLAARNAGEEDLEAMERAVRLMEEALPQYMDGKKTLEDMLELDDLFHLQCAAASHNRFYIQFVSIVHSAGTDMGLYAPVYGKYPEKYLDSIRFHRQLMEAIAAGDEDMAWEVMGEHIECIHQEIGGDDPREA